MNDQDILEAGFRTPLGDMVLSGYETPGDNSIPMKKIDPHLTFRWGRLSVRIA